MKSTGGGSTSGGTIGVGLMTEGLVLRFIFFLHHLFPRLFFCCLIFLSSSGWGSCC